MAHKKEVIASGKLSPPLFDAHIDAYYMNALRSLFATSAEASAFSDTIERLDAANADALAADIASALAAAPDVIRPRLRTLLNDLYRLNDPSNDWWDEIRRAEAEAEALAAFKEKLEDLSPNVRRSQRNLERQAERQAQRAELEALILAEVDAATDTVQSRWRDTVPTRDAVNREIAARLKRKGANGGKPIGLRRIEQARKGDR
jgi:hypothetical protein